LTESGFATSPKTPATKATRGGGPDLLPDLTTTADTVQLNPNPAPAQILRSLPGMDEAAAERIIQWPLR